MVCVICEFRDRTGWWGRNRDCCEYEMAVGVGVAWGCWRKEVVIDINPQRGTGASVGAMWPHT